MWGDVFYTWRRSLYGVLYVLICGAVFHMGVSFYMGCMISYGVSYVIWVSRVIMRVVFYTGCNMLYGV